MVHVVTFYEYKCHNRTSAYGYYRAVGKQADFIASQSTRLFCWIWDLFQLKDTKGCLYLSTFDLNFLCFLSFLIKVLICGHFVYKSAS